MGNVSEAKFWLRIADRDAIIPKTHDIVVLHQLCKVHLGGIEIETKIAKTLTDFAVATRYIYNRHNFTQDTTDFALKQAANVLTAVKNALTLDEDA